MRKQILAALWGLSVGHAALGAGELYCIIDLSAGAFASSYPVTYLDEPPSGGFNVDEYKTTKLVLRRMEPWTFMMCGEYETTLTKPYYIGVFEMTQKQYELVTGHVSSTPKSDTYPVRELSYERIRGKSTHASWPDAESVDVSSFIGVLRQRTGLAFDLPTEAQWEYACRAGTSSEYNNGGNTEAYLKLVGRYNANRSDGHGEGTWFTDVGSYLPNEWGLYDMHGNIEEWCLDVYVELCSPQVDPFGTRETYSPVVRGGSWSDSAFLCTSSYRRSSLSNNSSAGFRLALCIASPNSNDNGNQDGNGEGGSGEGGGQGNQGGEDDGGNVSGNQGGNDNGDKLNETVDGVVWYYSVTNEEATITAAKMAATLGNAQGNIIIPSHVGGYPVTKLGDGCLWYSPITSVVIPEGVTEIGDSAFYCDTVLHSVSIPQSMTCIQSCAFSYCPLRSVNIPNGVEEIGYLAFYGCQIFETLTLPKSIAVVGPGAFLECYGLKKVVLPTRRIDFQKGSWVESPFSNCTNLQSVYYPGDAIGNDYFSVFPTNATLYVLRESTGWGVEIPGIWNGRPIAYNEGDVGAQYCVINLSAGALADSYPVTYYDEPPEGGFDTDEYKTTNLVLCRIEPGTFMMCGEYETTLTKPYYIGMFEVTQRQYELVMGSNPSSHVGGSRPVENVSYHMIRGSGETANWPSSTSVTATSFMGVLRSRTCLDFDLPTEAQWEYACRAGTAGNYNNGGTSEDDLVTLGRYSGNIQDGKGGYSSNHTTAGSYLPNAWHLYDMHGNVWEWCLDWSGNLSGPQTDPTGPTSGQWGTYRVLRGGSWSHGASDCTSTSRRLRFLPSDINDYYGFRLATPCPASSGNGSSGENGEQGNQGDGNDDTRYEETINDVTWTFTVNDGEATIVGANPAVGNLNFPSRLGGFTVTKLGTDAFYENTWIGSVTIPATITDLGLETFGWNNVTNVYFLGDCPANPGGYGSWLLSGAPLQHYFYPKAFADSYANVVDGTFGGYVDVAARNTVPITIPATNSVGVFACSANAGDIIKVQYVEGEWSLYYTWNTESPDADELENDGKRAVIVNLDAPDVVLATVPANTAAKPFFWAVPEAGVYALRINDTNFGDNTGEVRYRVSVGEISIENGPVSVTLAEALGDELVWTSGGNAPWTGGEVSGAGGGLCVRSGEVGDSQYSWLETTVDGPGDISFSWKVSSQARLDRLTFTADGETKAFIAGTTASVTNWSNCSFAIEGRGTHTLRWTYAKSPSGTTGEDCGWLDNVQWNPNNPPDIGISEALDAQDLAWTSGGSDAAPWEAVESPSFDGEDACAAFADAASGLARITTEVEGPGTVSFHWRIECGTSFAGIAFMVDGEDVEYCENDSWASFECAVFGNGSHTIAWEYFWDGTPNGDAAFLDCVSWSPAGGTAEESVTVESVTIPHHWLSLYAAPILERLGCNYESAAHAIAANGVNKVWECFVAGISPTNAAARFEAWIDFVNGSPVVKWNPDLNEGGTKQERVYTVEGRESLTDGKWGPTNAASRFFHVKVSMP